jgi:hypothetical protein
VQFHVLLVADVTPLQHMQNESCRMIHSPVTRVEKWRNRNLVIFPPFSTPKGGERGANQNVPLTANSSQVPVECVGILGGAGPYTVSGIQSAENSKKNFSSVLRPSSAVSVSARQSPYAPVIRHGIGMRGMCHTHFPDLADFGRILPNAVDRGYALRINFGDS